MSFISSFIIPYFKRFKFNNLLSLNNINNTFLLLNNILKEFLNNKNIKF
jgi:hypothetical protein